MIEKDSAVSRQHEICEKTLNAGKEGRKEKEQSAQEESSMDVNTSDVDKSTEQMKNTEISSENILKLKSDGVDEGELPQKESNVIKEENESPKSIFRSDLKDDRGTSKEDQVNVTSIPGNEETSKAESLVCEMTSAGVSKVSTKTDQTGNLLLIPPNANTDLAEQLEQVKIQPLLSGNLKVIEQNAEETSDEQSYSSSDSKEDPQYDNDGDEAALSNAAAMQETGNSQTKRNKKQKKNKKKRKKEQEDRQKQLELSPKDVQASDTQNEHVRETIDASIDSNAVVQNTSCLSSESETVATNYNSTKDNSSQYHAVNNNASHSVTVVSEFVFGGGSDWGKKENIDKQEGQDGKKVDLFKIENKKLQGDQSDIKNDQMQDNQGNANESNETEVKSIEDNDSEMGEDDNDPSEMGEDKDNDPSESRGDKDNDHGDDTRNVSTLSRKQKRKLKKKEKAKALEEKKIEGQRKFGKY